MNTAPTIPDHTLLRPIGRGAYGEVWLAVNVMGALRAVKIIGRRHFESERPYEREFAGIQRYEPVSRSSGGLVHVLHVGRNDAEGYFYYVMELADAVENVISGSVISKSVNSPTAAAVESRETDSLITDYSPHTLRADLKRLGRIATADCLRIAIDVVSGLAQLHQHGLVHRDVKPGNIIFVHGRAKLADIGLVSAGGEGRTFVGTEGYIPPEGPGSPTADLFALGVVLYEASTGFPPERFPDVPTEWFRDGAEEDPLELHEVILKACEGQRERRYQSAEEMQADLALLQSGQSVRRVRALEHRVMWARRIGWAAALLVVLAVGGALFAGWRARVAEQMSARETALRTRAEAAEQDARQKLYNAYLAQARATVLSGDVGRRFETLEAVRQAAAIRSTPELRREAFAALALSDLRVEHEIDVGTARNNAWADPAFSRYAVSLRRGDVEIYSLPDQRLLQTLPASTNLNAQVLRFSPNGRYLAFKRDHSYGDSDLEVWDLVATQRVVLAHHAIAHHATSFHPTAPQLLAGRPSGRLVTWDLERGTEMKSWRLPPHRVVAYSPEGSRFAISYGQGRSNIVEVRDATNALVLAAASFPDVVSSLPWHPDGRHIAVPCADSSVSLMDAQDGTVRLLGKHKAQAVSAEFSSDGDFLFSGGWDGELNIWNLRNHQRELTAPLTGPFPQVSADGRKVAQFAKSRLQIFEFSRAAECRELAGELRFGARHGQFSDDGRWLAVPTINGVAAWDLHRAGPAGLFTRAGQGAAIFNTPGEEFFGWSDRKLFRWRLIPGAESNAPPNLEPLPIFSVKAPLYSLHLLRLRSALLSSDGEGIRIVPLTNVTTGEGERMKWPVGRVAVSADEKWLASAFDRQKYIRIFSLPDLSSARRTLTNPAPVRSLAFAPNARRLTVVGETLLTVWDTTTWEVIRKRPIAGDAGADYTPDGRTLLLKENPRSGALLDADTLEPLLPLPVWTQPLAMSADGKQLVVSIEGRRVQLWNLVAVRARFRELGIDWQD